MRTNPLAAGSAGPPRRRPSGDGRRGPNGSVLGGHRRAAGTFDELHVEAQGLELLEQHVEALGQTCLERVLALHDRLVHTGAALDVVALDGEELLQRVSGAVGFHGPGLHLAEALPAELGLAAEGLLRDERDRKSTRLNSSHVKISYAVF